MPRNDEQKGFTSAPINWDIGQYAKPRPNIDR